MTTKTLAIIVTIGLLPIALFGGLLNAAVLVITGRADVGEHNYHPKGKQND